VRYGSIGGLEYEVPQKLTHLLQCIRNLYGLVRYDFNRLAVYLSFRTFITHTLHNFWTFTHRGGSFPPSGGATAPSHDPREFHKSDDKKFSRLRVYAPGRLWLCARVAAAKILYRTLEKLLKHPRSEYQMNSLRYATVRWFRDIETRPASLPARTITRRFVHLLRCPKGRFVYGMREGGAA